MEKCIGLLKSTAFGHTIGSSIAHRCVESNGKITKSWLCLDYWRSSPDS